MGDQEGRPLEDRQRRPRPAGELLDVRIEEACFRADLVLEDRLLAEEELELQQVAPGEGCLQAPRSIASPCPWRVATMMPSSTIARLRNQWIALLR